MKYLTIVRFAVALLLCLAVCGHAEARQVCAWIVETPKANDEHLFELWLQADAHLEFLYEVRGTGITSQGFKAHSPASATYILDAGKAEKVWHFGTTVPAPAKVDIAVELHQWPKDIFSKEATPIIAAFSFARAVPERERRVPPSLATKQCKIVV